MTVNHVFMGSTPIIHPYSFLAQLEERMNTNHQVASSSLAETSNAPMLEQVDRTVLETGAK